MKQIISVAILVVVALLLALKTADFLVSSSSKKALKDRLADLYVFTQEGDWSSFVAKAAARSEQFLTFLFGKRAVSFRGAALFGLVGTAYVIAITDFLVRSNFGSLANATWGRNSYLQVAIMIILNLTIDLASLSITRRILRKLASATTSSRAAALMCRFLLVGYFAIGVSFGLSFIVALLLGVPSTGGELVGIIGMITLWPFILFTELRPLILVFLPACFSTITLLSIIAASWLIAVSKPITRRPLGVVLEALDSAPSGIFGTLVKGLAAILAALVTARGVLG